jgi:hypothetical protein
MFVDLNFLVKNIINKINICLLRVLKIKLY